MDFPVVDDDQTARQAFCKQTPCKQTACKPPPQNAPDNTQKRRLPQAATPDLLLVAELCRLAETQEICAHHLFQPTQFLQRLGVHPTINLDKSNGLPTGLFTAQMKGRDIDTVRPAQAAKIANEAGLVIITQI
jgi:hypothetical protein